MIVFNPEKACSGDMVIASITDLGLEKQEVLEFSKSILKITGAQGSAKFKKYKDGLQFLLEIEKDIKNFNVSYKNCLEAVSPAIKNFSRKTVSGMIALEKEIHGTAHLHELGSVDTLVDVFTSAYCLSKFDFNARTMRISVGTGKIQTKHGIVSNPPPLSKKLLERFPYRKKKIQFEISTPTGIAILTNFKPIAKIPEKIKKTGKGYGQNLLKDMEGNDYDNVLEVYEIE